MESPFIDPRHSLTGCDGQVGRIEIEVAGEDGVVGSGTVLGEKHGAIRCKKEDGQQEGRQVAHDMGGFRVKMQPIAMGWSICRLNFLPGLALF